MFVLVSCPMPKTSVLGPADLQGVFCKALAIAAVTAASSLLAQLVTQGDLSPC